MLAISRPSPKRRIHILPNGSESLRRNEPDHASPLQERTLIDPQVITAGKAVNSVVQGSYVDMQSDFYVSPVFLFDRCIDDRHLIDGLRGALTRVPVFGGRLRARGDALEIVCCDAGVPMTVVDVEATLADAMREVTNPDSFLIDWVVDSTPVEQRPLLTVRVSRLADGGMALGLSWNHVVGDMASFMQFMRVWSALVEGETAPEILIVEDREGYLDRFLWREEKTQITCPLLSEEDLRQENPDAPTHDNSVVQIYFGENEVGRMRQSLSRAVSRQLSSNDVLCAHLLTTLWNMEAESEPWWLAIVVDLRHRLGMPTEVIGNFSQIAAFQCSAVGQSDVVAAQIRSVLEKYTQIYHCRCVDRAITNVGRSRSHRCVFWPSREARGLGIIAWTRMGIYDITFGGQHPSFFSQNFDYRSLRRPWGGVYSEGPGGVGFLFTLRLPARVIEKLRSPQGRKMIHRFGDTGDVRRTPADLAQHII
ncbi:acyltransferase [Streptomyces sp. NPDC059680]|uniref:acyltransferase n=1 Tax=Streptomyces sp. NPDC059680 TaxID=3346904 RepID=UPI00368B709F